MLLFDFFSGIGGFSLAAERMGWDIMSQCEIDPFCQEVLQKHWPDVYLHDDIRTFTHETYQLAGGNSGEETIFTGGFPCQPYSTAGEQKGEDDSRNLWPEYYRVIRECKPTYVVGENVGGLASMEGGNVLSRILSDLENAGYQVEVFLLPAGAIGAWHRRERLWIVSHFRGRPFPTILPHTPGLRSPRPRQSEPSQYSKEAGQRKAARTIPGCPSDPWRSEPRVDRVANGIPNGLDRLTALGNAISPQVALEIFRAIKQHSNEN